MAKFRPHICKTFADYAQVSDAFDDAGNWIGLNCSQGEAEDTLIKARRLAEAHPQMYAHFHAAHPDVRLGPSWDHS